MTKNIIIFILSVLVVYLFLISLPIEDPNINQICHEKYMKAISSEQYTQCIGIVSAMQEISEAHKYETDVYDCSDYSTDLKKALDDIYIDSEIIVGNWDEKTNKAHAWVGIWVEPINGEFVNSWNHYERSPGETKIENGILKFFPEK
ncbi:MAG: hypothetical protein H8E55_68065 [Pelagibacterales bacterium]|nr:hypothetical protein [Pelagibacterales bacterium]